MKNFCISYIISIKNEIAFKQLCNAIRSTNLLNQQFDIFLYHDLTLSNKHKLELNRLCKNRIFYKDISWPIEYFLLRNNVNAGHSPTIGLAKLFLLADYQISNYKQCLYLDIDTEILNSNAISIFSNYTENIFSIFGVLERESFQYTHIRNIKNVFPNFQKTHYFNSGVLLFNNTFLLKIENLFNCFFPNSQYKNVIKYQGDQSLINALFNIQPISRKYNFASCTWNNNEKYAQSDALIRHYAGKDHTLLFNKLK